MKLLLVRHGEASFNAPTDAQRPLTSRGGRLVEQQAQASNIPWVDFECIWASPYLRAQQTAKLLQQQLALKNIPIPIETLKVITPHGEPQEVQEFLLQQSQQGIILVTHQPLVSGLIGHFCHGDEFLGEPMMPASMALLEGGLAAANCLTLTHLVHP